MKFSSKSAFRSAMLSGVGALWLVPAMAVAQEAAQTEAVVSQSAGGVANVSGERAASDEIVVTGTILRGAPPVGSSIVSVGQERLQSQGATTSNELLATIPQVSNLFNNVPTSRLGVSASAIQVVRPNLRNLASETSSSASTLVLFDGHRVAPVGVTQNAVDPDLIPSIAIERVEVVTDGGSATYGSDAVGGVINFITRKRFDGVQVQARYGFADDYRQVDVGAIVGTDWGSGSLFAAYNYQHNDAIFGRDRDWIRDVDWLSPNLTPRGRACSPGNVQIGQNMFALPGLAAGANICDPTDDQTSVPSSTRHGAIVGLHQELADWLRVDLRGFYGERTATSHSPFRGSVTVTGGSNAQNPRQFYYTPVPGQNATANQTVFFSFAPLLGTNTARSVTAFREWGANAEFRADLTENWQLRTLFNYSRSSSNYNIQQFNQTLLNSLARGTRAATAINFYNPTAADLPLIQQLINSELAGEGKEDLFNARAIVDGTLFTLPGGEVKLAVGYEYMHDRFAQRIAPVDQVIGAIETVPFTPYSRSVNSLFGEVQVPLVGEDNSMGFIHALTVAGSVRYDHFSDFGSTVNPKVGVNFKPVSWLNLRGNYSTSFNAPSPVDQLGVARNTARFDARNAPFVRPGDSPSVIGLVSIQGSTPGLRPQTAKTWSLGIDIDPPFVPGLHASATYYNVKFQDVIRIPTPNPGIYANFPTLITSNPAGLTLTQITNFLNESGAPNAASVLNTVAGRCNATTGICDTYALIDFRQGNYGRVDVEGLDFNVNYRTATSFGGIDASVSGNYILKRTSQTGPGAPVIDELRAYVLQVPTGSGFVTLPNNANPRLSLQATLGANIGNFRAQATLNHSSGYGLVRCDRSSAPNPVCNPSATAVPTQSGLPQDRVKDFNTVNLFFKYDVPSESVLLKDLSLSLNINNVFDADPPVYKLIGASTPGYVNGFTLGRLVQFGIQKKF